MGYTSIKQLELLDILGKMYTKSVQDNPTISLEDKFTAQLLQTSRSKLINDDFLNRIQRLNAQNDELNRLRAELLNAARDLGFNRVEQALNQVENTYGLNPLQQAFQQQDFSLAKKLIDLGAKIGPLEKAYFELALDGKKAQTDYGFPATAYSEEKKFPAVKHFGLTLGVIMTGENGTSSQIAHIAPTYKIMTDSLATYVREHPEQTNMKSIAEAFSFANSTGEFSRSTSMNPNAGQQLAGRISLGAITTIPIACEGHFMGLSIVPDGPGSKSGYMVVTNRGIGSQAENCGTQIYRLDDLKKVDPKFITAMMNGLSNGTSYQDIMAQVRQVADHKPPIEFIAQKAQKYDNCSIANPRANIQGILLCLQAIAKKGFDNLSVQDHVAVKKSYKEYTGAMRTEKVSELIKELGKNPSAPDLINIGREYLKQHPKVDAGIKERLEQAISHVSSGLQNKPNYGSPKLSAPD